MGTLEDVKNLVTHCDFGWVTVSAVTPPQSPLEALRDSIGDCRLCRLHEGRANLVFGVGNPNAELVFVGEGPGKDEDLQGEPFVGAAGQLLTRIIEAMGFKRSDVYICNVVKCRPPENRTPQGDEMDTCKPFLLKQLDIINPRVIVALGNVAVKALLETNDGISSLRGRFHDFRGVKLMPTFHPAYLLRNPNDKRLVWDDMKMVLGELGRTAPEKG